MFADRSILLRRSGRIIRGSILVCVRTLIPILWLGFVGFECNPCASCDKPNAKIIITLVPPQEDDGCECACQTGWWYISIFDETQVRSIYNEHIEIGVNSGPINAEFIVPSCKAYNVATYFLCHTPPDPPTSADCASNVFYSNHQDIISTGCGGETYLMATMCASIAHTHRRKVDIR
jgi:hypothetical protein